MRLIFTLFSFLLLGYTAGAQKLTGIWRGYFSSSNGLYRDGAREEMYKYEIQIEQQSNNGITGVTYSYKSTVFYGKAQIQGILTLPAKSMIIKEIKLLDLKIGEKSEPCLMTCYLDYTKMGKLEVLEGTFISVNIKDKGDCGSGKVYLERVASSDFKKEAFLVRKKIPEPDSNKALTAKPKPNPAAKPATKPPVTVPNRNQSLQRSTTLPPVVKKQEKKGVPKTTPPADKNKPVAPVTRVPEASVNSNKEEPVSAPKTEPIQKGPIPRVLVERENNLVRTITTSEENIQVDLYDNSIIDNDTISVYHNNQLVVSNGRLDVRPITVKIKCSRSDPRHEFIVVAENLGEIPPNTALMVITAGRERYEVFLASNEKRNAKVVINYVPKE